MYSSVHGITAIISFADNHNHFELTAFIFGNSGVGGTQTCG
jgi:hypothetical protein